MKLNVLPASAGAQWVQMGIRTFFRQPIALGALTILFLIALIFIGLIVPVVGTAAALTLTPAFTAGLMAAARAADGGKTPLPLILFAAFRQGAARARAIVALGLLYAAAIMMVAGVFILIGGGAIDTFFRNSFPGNTQMLTPDLLNAQMAALIALMFDLRFQIAVLAALALYALVWMAFWHAPALVHWHGVAPVKSLFFSAIAVLRNMRAFLLYGALWLIVSWGANMALVIVAMLAGSVGSVVIRAGLLPLTLVVTAMFFTSQWFSFRDSFTPDDGDPSSGGAPVAR